MLEIAIAAALIGAACLAYWQSKRQQELRCWGCNVPVEENAAEVDSQGRVWHLGCKMAHEADMRDGN